jgi:hypothetical protein
MEATFSANARIERRSQLVLSDGVAVTRILVDAHRAASESLELALCPVRT